jgi:hypothetical protein
MRREEQKEFDRLLQDLKKNTSCFILLTIGSFKPKEKRNISTDHQFYPRFLKGNWTVFHVDPAFLLVDENNCYGCVIPDKHDRYNYKKLEETFKFLLLCQNKKIIFYDNCDFHLGEEKDFLGSFPKENKRLMHNTFEVILGYFDEYPRVLLDKNAFDLGAEDYHKILISVSKLLGEDKYLSFKYKKGNYIWRNKETNILNSKLVPFRYGIAFPDSYIPERYLFCQELDYNLHYLNNFTGKEYRFGSNNDIPENLFNSIPKTVWRLFK